MYPYDGKNGERYVGHHSKSSDGQDNTSNHLVEREEKLDEAQDEKHHSGMQECWYTLYYCRHLESLQSFKEVRADESCIFTRCLVYNV